MLEDQLQTLQHVQACKDRELVYLRVAMTVRRLEEDQGVEHRLVVQRAPRRGLGSRVAQVAQHLQQMRMFLDAWSHEVRMVNVVKLGEVFGAFGGRRVLDAPRKGLDP